MNSKSGFSLDPWGMVASTTCAIHCVIVAVAPAVLAASGLGALISHEAEWAFTVVAAGLAVISAIIGLRAHNSLKIFAILMAGASILIASRFLEEWGAHGFGTVVAVFGSICVLVGHFQNLRACRSCELGS